tara:strand:- start:2390 stop:4348 length:1959 start_codon:yes stop_codon:yes gene_type:complete
MSKIRVVGLSTYTSPDISVKKNKEWVTYGEKNTYFQYLIDRYTGSPTNNAVIKGFSQLIYGKGLDATDSSRKPSEYASMINLFKKDCTRKLVNDLKLMGQCAIQIVYSKDRKTIAQVEHIPVETLAMEKCNDDGEIEGYYYSSDWLNMKPSEIPQRIPAFGTSNEPIEIIYIRPYVPGFYYFSPVDYQGGLQYAQLEEEVSNYHINNIQQGLNPSMILNFNNGVPNEEERDLIESRIIEKFSGSSNAGRFILAFNENAETAATIEPVPLSDAHNQYQFLSDESMRKIMIAHGVVSPMLLGIKDQSGLGNNADELKTASTLMDNTVIRPFQELLLDAFDKILAFNNITLNLYFKTLQPLEFQDLSNVTDSVTREEETGVKMSLTNDSYENNVKVQEKVAEDLMKLKEVDGKTAYETIAEAESKALEQGCEGYHEHIEGDKTWYMPCESHDQVELGVTLAEELILLGESEDIEGYELVDEREVDYNSEESLDAMLSLASTGTARPKARSKEDGTSNQDSQAGVLFKVRYKYAHPIKSKGKSREFCNKMESANKVYRKEDIQFMSKKEVNPGFGPPGSREKYDIWLYKGGPRCHHAWYRRTYMLKDGKQTEITTGKARSKGFKPLPNEREVPTPPNNMKNKGFAPNNPNIPKDAR